MNLKNDAYVILIGTKKFTERYYRDADGWLKESARGNTFRATSEQVLNHLLPALAAVKPGLVVAVEHHERRRATKTAKKANKTKKTKKTKKKTAKKKKARASS